MLFLILYVFLLFHTPDSQRIKIKKNENIDRYHYFTHVCKYTVPEMGCATDGPTAKVTIEVGTPPK